MVVSEWAIFAVLLDDGRGYGAEIKERVRARTKGRLVIKDGSLYTVLRRMEGDGLVYGCEGAEKSRNGRPPRYYELTSSGLKAAREQFDIVTGLFNLPRKR